MIMASKKKEKNGVKQPIVNRTRLFLYWLGLPIKIKCKIQNFSIQTRTKSANLYVDMILQQKNFIGFWREPITNNVPINQP